MREDPTDVVGINPAVRRLSVIESRAWAITAFLAIVGTALVVSTAPRIGAVAVYNAGLACFIVVANVVMGALGLRHQRVVVVKLTEVSGMERRALQGLGVVLGGVEDELAKRRRH
jgi:hypothetical protein